MPHSVAIYYANTTAATERTGYVLYRALVLYAFTMHIIYHRFGTSLLSCIRYNNREGICTRRYIAIAGTFIQKYLGMILLYNIEEKYYTYDLSTELIVFLSR